MPRPAPPPDGPRWGVGEVVLGYVGAVLAYLVVSGAWVAATGDEEVTLGLFVVGLAAQWAGMVGTAVVLSRRRGTGRLARDVGLRVRPVDVPVGIVTGVACQLALVPLLYLPFRLLSHDVDLSDRAKEVTDLAGGGAGLVVLALCLVVGAPLVEELFYRGLLLRAVERRHGRAWGVWVSAAVFGIAHFQPLQLLGLVAFGVVLATLVERSGRLGPAVIAHMAFNATTVAVLVATR